MVLAAACNKAIDEPLRSVPNGKRDSTTNIRTILAGSPYHLFSQAFNRLGLDSSFAFYTVFAPTDSVMQAAGLTASVIDGLPTDSLYKIIGYQITQGDYSDSLLQTIQLPIKVPTLREDVSFYTATYSPSVMGRTFRHSLYLVKKDVVYVNGVSIGNSGLSLKAGNGRIYPVNHLFAAPVTDIWSIITSRPELSMYVAANRLVDSFTAASGFYQNVNDTAAFFSNVNYDGNVNAAVSNTVFAPTNDAFIRAGFNTVDDIRQYVKKVIPGYGYINTGTNFYNVYIYVDMDSVLKQHYISGATPLFYMDLLNGSAINNGVLNTNSWTISSFITNPTIPAYYTQFSGQDGTVNIKYSRDPAVPAAVLSPGGPIFQGLNGNVFEIDQLFYPHN